MLNARDGIVSARSRVRERGNVADSVDVFQAFDSKRGISTETAVLLKFD